MLHEMYQFEQMDHGETQELMLIGFCFIIWFLRKKKDRLCGQSFFVIIGLWDNTL